MAQINGQNVCDLSGTHCVDMIRVRTKDDQVLDVNEKYADSCGLGKPISEGQHIGQYPSKFTRDELVAKIA